MKFFKDPFITFNEMPSWMHKIAAAAAFKTLCLPNILRLKSMVSWGEVNLKKDFIPSDL